MDLLTIVWHSSHLTLTWSSTTLVFCLITWSPNKKTTRRTPRADRDFLTGMAVASPDLKDEVGQLCSSWATARMRTISLERQLFLKTQEAAFVGDTNSWWVWGWGMLDLDEKKRKGGFCLKAAG